MKRRNVKCRLIIESIVAVPEDYDKEMIEFFWNGSSSCVDNVLNQIEDRLEAEGACCFCSITRAEYLGEA